MDPGVGVLPRRKPSQGQNELLVSSQLLVHFDPDLQIVLACDALAYDVGTVLSHRMHDGTERPREGLCPEHCLTQRRSKLRSGERG